MTSDKLKRLPVWAQMLIEDKERELDRLKREVQDLRGEMLNEQDFEKSLISWSRGYMDKSMTLPASAQVAFGKGHEQIMVCMQKDVVSISTSKGRLIWVQDVTNMGAMYVLDLFRPLDKARLSPPLPNNHYVLPGGEPGA